MSTANPNKLKIKDIITVVLLALINVVIFFASSVLYATPITIILMPVFFALLEGIVYFIIGTKVKKPGAILIYSIVRAIMGGYLPYIILFILSGAIAELLLWKMGYAKFVSAAKEGADCFIDWMRGSLFGQVAGMAILPSTLLGILPVGCLLYMHGTLSAETFLAVIVLSFGVMQPLITAFSYTDDIAQVTTIVGEVAEVLSGEDMQRPRTAERLPSNNSIELKDVRFAYHDKEVLHGIDLHIAPGTVNALVGPSGSGKSTIARLIASLWDVKDGEIDLGGVDIRTLPLAECTKHIAYVSQDNYLFDLSVMDNIRMGRKGATDAEVIDAAKKCGCHEFIMGLENGYQTVCGASGGHLSGGERQRISIARAMLKDAPIVILDEATSYTDPENEAVIQSALGRLVRGKTLLVIAHRLSTIADADQIIVVNQGKIEATGTQAELLASCPLYQTMWEAHISVKDDGEVA